MFISTLNHYRYCRAIWKYQVCRYSYYILWISKSAHYIRFIDSGKYKWGGTFIIIYHHLTKIWYNHTVVSWRAVIFKYQQLPTIRGLLYQNLYIAAPLAIKWKVWAGVGSLKIFPDGPKPELTFNHHHFSVVSIL